MKKHVQKLLLVVCVGLTILACSSCEPVATSSDEDAGPAVVYTRYNLHYYDTKGQLKAGYANYVDPPGHGFLPYNSKVVIGKYRRGFLVTVEGTGQDIYFEYKSQNMAGMSKEEYLEAITSPTAVSYDALSAVDQQGIQDGKVTPGMSKQGVTVAWGYPAKHRTPSMDADLWYYWQNRMATVGVKFDAEGKVSSLVR